MADRVITKINAAPKFLTFQAATKCEKNVAAYARVSTDHEDQQTSLAVQVDYYKKKIKEHPGWTFVKVYADEGISGLSTVRRESFLQMIADCEAGDRKEFVVYNPSKERKYCSKECYIAERFGK